MVYRLFFIFILLFTHGDVIAQPYEEKNFRHYTTKDGLSDNFISGLEQDSTGFIWISTYRGLNRFDGNIFKQFLDNGNKNSIPDNAIFSMELFPGNQLSVATDDGGQVISTKTLETKNLEVPTEDALRYWSNACRYISMDKEGNYGVSTKTGFYIFSSSGQLKKRLDRYTAKDIGRSWMMFGNRLYQMPDGNLMQQNSLGFKIYDRNNKFFRDAQDYYPAITSLLEDLRKNKDFFCFISTHHILVVNSVNNSFDLIDIKNGKRNSFPACYNLIKEVGWQTNLYNINGNTWAFNSEDKGFFLIQVDTISKTVSCSPEKYFGNYSCTVLFSDIHQRLWVGTTEGLFMQIKRPQIINTFKLADKADPDKFIIKSLFLSENQIFAGTDNRKILVIDKKTNKIIYKILLDSLGKAPEHVMSLLKIHPDTMWVATTSRLLWLHTSNFSYGRVFPQFPDRMLAGGLQLFMDKKKNIWIGTNSINTIYIYNTKTKIFDSLKSKSYPLLNVNNVNRFAEDNKGNIWIAGDAIARWNNNLGKIDTLIEQLPSQKNRKKGFYVMSDSKGDIWTIVNDDGIAKITGRDNTIHIRPGNLLPDNPIGPFPSMLENRIYLSTTEGIGFLNTSDLKAVVFNAADGLPNQKVSSYQFYYDGTDRSTWFASKNILCQVPFQTSYNYINPPVLHVSDASVANKSVINYPPENISLKHFQNDIKISLSAINFTDPENMRFAYRFKNKKDSSWIQLERQQSILLTNMSPGNYRLEVKAYAFDNKWEDQKKEIEILIKPPFWKTAWFYVLLGLLFTGGIFYLYQRRIKQINQKANLDRQLAQTEMKALHSQMNPHFIFNSLNSIMEMVLQDEKTNAARYLSSYAQLVRLNLEHSQRTFITLRENIDYLKLYLELEHTRTSSFVYTMELDENLNPDDILLPPMLIQPFIENAIWYGPSPDNLPMTLNIFFHIKKDQLLCIVDDNGIGIDASLKNRNEKMPSHTPLGIGNVRQRIQILNEKYKLHFTLVIEDKGKKNLSAVNGTKVTLGIPLNLHDL